MSHPDKKTSRPKARKEEKKRLKAERKAAREKAKRHTNPGLLLQNLGKAPYADLIQMAH